jgi:hypothetical protein
MTKTLQQVLTEQYPTLDQVFYGVVGWDWDNEKCVFIRAAWPSDLGTAPTDEQLTEWMNE